MMTQRPLGQDRANWPGQPTEGAISLTLDTSREQDRLRRSQRPRTGMPTFWAPKLAHGSRFGDKHQMRPKSGGLKFLIYSVAAADMFSRLGDADCRWQKGYLLPLIYVIAALPLILFLSFFRQPIGVADEWAHIARAAQLMDGHLFTQVAEAGKPPMGSIDPNFMSLTDQVHARRNEGMATLLPDIAPLHWTDQRALANYNSSVYFPAPYIVSMAALKVSSLLKLSIVSALQVANLFNGLICVAIAALAIALAPRAKTVIFVIAILPMTLFLFASASPDGPLISSALVVFALLARVLADRTSSPALFTLLAALLTVVAATKLPYLPFALSLIVATWLGSTVQRPSWVVPAGATLVVATVSIGWTVITNAGAIDVNWGAGVANPSEQIAFLLGKPLAIVTIAKETLGKWGVSYLHQMVGFLGWHDAPITVAGQAILLTLIMVTFVLDAPSAPFGRARLVTLLGLLASVGAIFASLFIATNPVGSLRPIEGVQGRYFLPLLPFLALLAPLALHFPGRKTLLALTLAVAVPVSTFELMRTVIDRYYA